MRARTLGVMLLLSAVNVGCGGPRMVQGTVRYPAQVPVRAFPRVWVASGHEPHVVELAEALLTHLAEDATVEARRVDLDDLEPLRAAGRIPTATAVVLVDAVFLEQVRSEVSRRPETVCGPMGCYTRTRDYIYDLPVAEGRLTLTVYEGPTARILQRVTVQEQDEGRDYPVMRRRIAERLAGRARELVDERVDAVRVALLPADLAGVDVVIDRVRQGDWSGGREALETLCRGDAFEALPPRQRARVLYDLGTARRFDPATLGDVDAHFEAAEAALLEAVRADPQPRYDQALAELRQHRQQVLLLIQQHAAAAHNRTLGEEAPTAGVPAPPPGYR